MRGIGKTTLARVVYDQMSGGFEGKCFLHEVSKYEPVCLQKMLFSEIFPGENFQFFNVFDGSKTISHMLRRKKVLVVIDDGDDGQKLKYLAEERDWFGSGSRIIITTRDEQVLQAYGVDDVYKPTTLNAFEALRLFSLKALKSDTLKNDFMLLSKSVVEYAGGLPLALQVLGSSLCGKGAAEWRSAIDRLKSEPEKEIHNCFRISFDGLKETEKNIFLDIAHFFKGWDRDFVTTILDGCGYHAAIVLDELIKKSLITVEYNKIWMHDLLQEMGRYIVRQKSLDEPGKRCRLSEESDVYHVLTQNSGTQAVEGMAINIITREQNETFTLPADAFLKMKKLRLLMVRGLLNSCDLIYLSNELRLFCWPGYPLESLPLSFQPDNLVALLLPNSSGERLWNGDRLKVVDLHNSQNLIETPDFTMAKNLESLNLESCTSLVAVHPSIAFLSELKLLNLRNCESLKSLPMKIGMKSLKTLILSGCLNLQKFPEIAGKMEHLLEVYLDGTSIEELPSSVGNLSSLKVLNLSDYCQPENLPTSFVERMYRMGCEVLNRMLFRKRLNSMALTLSRLSSLSSLTELNISGRNLGEGAIPSAIYCLSSLETLNLSQNNFVSLPADLCQLSKLHLLELAECDMLKSLPELPSSITAVGLDGCTSLEIVPNPTKEYNALNGIHYYGVNCFNLAANDNALRMLKGHPKAIANARQRFDILIPGSEIPE